MPTHVHQQPKVLTRALRREPGILLTLSHYPAGVRQEPHAHDHLQVSFLLAGEMRETIGRRSHELIAPALCVKPAGTEHANLWGVGGATLLSLRMRQPHGLDRCRTATWTGFASTALRPVLAAALADSHTVGLDQIADDLIAMTGGEAARAPAAAPPPWLRRVREAVADGEALTATEAAALAGVHRVHLSRRFRQHYGLPFSAYRRRVMVARAIEAALRSADSLAQIAQHAGFADQSHMHRAIAGIFGATPTRLRCAFARRP